MWAAVQLERISVTIPLLEHSCGSRAAARAQGLGTQPLGSSSKPLYPMAPSS